MDTHPSVGAKPGAAGPITIGSGNSVVLNMLPYSSLPCLVFRIVYKPLTGTGNRKFGEW